MDAPARRALQGDERMSRLTCELCHYSKPIFISASNCVCDTDYRIKLKEGLRCGYKDGKTCVVDDLNARERERQKEGR